MTQGFSRETNGQLVHLLFLATGFMTVCNFYIENEIDDDGAAALLETMKTNVSIINVHNNFGAAQSFISNNPCQKHLRDKLVEQIFVNRST